MRVDPIVMTSCVLAVLAACGGADDPDAAAPIVGVPPADSAAQAGGGAAPGAALQPAQPAAGQAGQSATVPGQAGAAPVDEPAMAGSDAPEQPDDPGDDDPGLVLDQCGLDTGFPGDEYCILPPPPDQGFQVHIGPDSYDNPGVYIMQPGDESTEDFPAVAGNDQDVFFYYRQYRMRPGSHHLIISQSSGGLGDGGRRLGGSQNVAKDNPDRGVTAPENEGIGMPLAARAPLNVQLHYINTSNAPVLREAWVNFWYKDPATVTEQAKEMFANGGLGMNIPAGQRTVLGPYSCAVAQAGRVVTLYGHRHANAPRFSAWRVRGGQRELIYESLNWAEPMVLEFNSIVDNPAPDRTKGIEGGHSGILDLMPGDALEWECEVDNTHDFALRFGNQTYDSEMCILIGDTVGPTVACQYL